MLVSRLLTRHWQPLIPQIDIFIYSMRHPEWLRSLWGDLPFVATSTRLFLPEFVLVFGAAWVVVRRPKSSVTLPLLAGTAICCGIYAFQQFALHSIVLRVPCHSSYMLVLVIGCVAMIAAELLSDDPRHAFALLLTLLALALPVVANGSTPDIPQSTLWISLAAVGVLATTLAFLRMNKAACLLLIGAVFVGPAFDPGLSWAWSRQGLLHGPSITTGPRADSYPWLMQLHQWIKPQVHSEAAVRFWWESNEGESMFDAIAAMYLDRRAVLSDAFDASSNEVLRARLESRSLLVFLTKDPARVPERMAIFAARGFTASNERRMILPYRGKNIYVILFDVRPSEGSPS